MTPKLFRNNTAWILMGHKLLKFISFSFQPRRWALIQRLPEMSRRSIAIALFAAILVVCILLFAVRGGLIVLCFTG